MAEETKTNEPIEAETPETTPSAEAGETADLADALLESAEPVELTGSLEPDAADIQAPPTGELAPEATVGGRRQAVSIRSDR